VVESRTDQCVGERILASSDFGGGDAVGFQFLDDVGDAHGVDVRLLLLLLLLDVETADLAVFVDVLLRFLRRSRFQYASAMTEEGSDEEHAGGG